MLVTPMRIGIQRCGAAFRMILAMRRTLNFRR
jgi:hypothetical protein